MLADAGSGPIRSLLRKHALMPSGVFPPCKCCIYYAELVASLSPQRLPDVSTCRDSCRPHLFAGCLYWAVELLNCIGLAQQNYICVVTTPQWEQLCKYSFNGCIILYPKHMIYLTILLLLSKCQIPIVCSYKNHFSEHICIQIFMPFNMKSYNDGTK